MINIGVTEKVFIGKVEINDKKTLVITVKQADGKKVSALDLLSGSSATEVENNEANFLMYMPSLTTYDDKNKPNEGKAIFDAFVDFKNQLNVILSRYLPEDAINFNPFNGLDVITDTALLFSSLQSQGFSEKFYKNFCDDFIRMITPFIGDENKLSRILLHRKSKEAYFLTIRRKYNQAFPFFESMDIAIPQSKLYTIAGPKTSKYFEAIPIDGFAYVPNFTNYELSKELDNPDRTEFISDTPTDTRTEQEKVNSMFKAPGSGSGGDAIPTFAIAGN